MSDDTIQHIEAAIERHDLALKACENADQERKAARTNLEDYLGLLVPLLSSEEGLIELSRMYWRNEIIGKMICQSMLKRHRTRFWPHPARHSFTCPECEQGFDLELGSWTQVSLQRATRGHSALCGSCRTRERARLDESNKLLWKKWGWLSQEEILAARAMPYDEYLQTHHWQVVRQEALKRAKFKCQVCNKARPLDVHHRTYERLGCEQNDDVVALCRECHKLFHDNGRLAKEEA